MINKKNTPNINFMMNYVADFIEGDVARNSFEENFINLFVEHLTRMKEESPRFTDDYGLYIIEIGFETSCNLADCPFRKRIRMRYNQLYKSFNGKFGRKLEKFNGRPSYNAGKLK